MTKEVAPTQSLERAVSLLFLLTVLTGLVFSAWILRTWMLDEQKVPVRSIQILGQTEFITPEALSAYIRTQHQESFFALNVDEMYDNLLAQPWIYQASVRKKWPDTVQVFVVEQIPVANWNGDQLVNQEGTVFSGNIQLPYLPKLFGPNGAEKTALTGLNAIANLLAEHELEIDTLLLTERFAWQVELKSGIKINLGRQNFIERVQRFVNLYPLITENEQQIEYVDLRYDTGAAVKFATQQSS